MTGPVTVVAVIGPVEPALLTAWCEHYQRLGVDRFTVAFHIPDAGLAAVRAELVATYQSATGGAPELVVTGPWHEHTNGELRDELRERAGESWHLLADADEFQQHRGGLSSCLAAAAESGAWVVGGFRPCPPQPRLCPTPNRPRTAGRLWRWSGGECVWSRVLVATSGVPARSAARRRSMSGRVTARFTVSVVAQGET
ncbi:MAG: glycosyltransferase family 2 protein [Actinomycetota bacterium]|nr:glycosyltransferase family 2 protein [Actinomycetota bacterium]